METGSGGGATVASAGAAIEAAAERIAAAGCEDPRGDAAILVAAALAVAPDSLDPAAPVGPEQASAIEASVARRVDREPVAYIVGHEVFRGLDISVDARVLIPRRETGLLVDAALDLPEGAHVHEIGTGSGAVALALLSERPDLRVTASDLSPEAAEVARANAEKLGLGLEVTVSEGLPEEVTEADMVLANLPYVTDATIYERSPEIQREPRIAVTGECGEDGLGVIRGVLAEIPSGWLVGFEHDTHHGPAMREMLSEARTMTDHMGGERVTVGRVP